MKTEGDLKRRINEAFALAEKDAAIGNYTAARAKAVRENMAEEIDGAIVAIIERNFGKKEIAFCPGHFSK